MKLDKPEKHIVRLLQRQGRIANVDLAESVGLSASPCYRRVRALEEAGVISGYGARLNQRAIGLQVTAFVMVALDKQDERKQRAFLDEIEREEHVVECHVMSGAHDFLLKVVARSIDHFSELAMERILKFPGVKDIESNFSLRAVKEAAPLPVG